MFPSLCTGPNETAGYCSGKCCPASDHTCVNSDNSDGLGETACCAHLDQALQCHGSINPNLRAAFLTTALSAGQSHKHRYRVFGCLGLSLG